jgi:type I restriction enzyme, R subunit
MNLIQTLEQEEVARLGKKVPVFQAGEGDKERVQAYEVGEPARVSPLEEGVPVDFKDTDASIRSARARLIDFDRPDNNDFLAVNQFTVVGTKERRPDVVLFINGLPVVLMELKRPGDVNAMLRGAFNQTHG